MTLLEKTQKSSDNKVFTLHKEGLFYKCYNKDAMVFVQHVKAYKISEKFIKSVGETVYSIGFPVSEVEKGTLSLEIILGKISAASFMDKGQYIEFSLVNDSLKHGYEDWKDSICSVKKDKPLDPQMLHLSNLSYQTIISDIKRYDLANTTPMQSLGFVQQLKEKVLQIQIKHGII